MAITRLQLPREMYANGDIVEMTESLEAGAPPIKYSGDRRPQPEMTEMVEDIQMSQGPTNINEIIKQYMDAGLSYEEILGMLRQSAAYGGIMGADGRKRYLLGSIKRGVKKIFKKGKKVLDNPLVQTGLSLFPATRPYAMAYSALRNKDPISAYMAYSNMGPLGFDATNPWTKKNVLTGTTQAIQKVASNNQNNNADTSAWQKALNLLLKSKNEQGEYKYNPLKVAIGAGAGLLGIAGIQARENRKMPTLNQVIGDRGSKIGLDDIQMKVQAAIDSGDKASYENLRVTENLTFLPPWESIKRAEGGRIGYAGGGATSAEMLQLIQKLRAEGKTELEIQQILQQMFSAQFKAASQQGITSSMAVPDRQSILEEIINYTPVKGGPVQQFDMAKIQETIPRKVMQTSEDVPQGVSQMMKGMMRPSSDVPQELQQMIKGTQMPKENEMPLPDINPYAAAQGGRIGAQEGGLMSLDGMEMDLRGGGFVPIGAKEKADDVPARLSKNEFVFTADAVKAAGDGDVDRGADKMYNTMKQLESRVA